MSAPPYMPLFVADYLGDTRHLTTEQHGAYLLLLMAMWRGGGVLPDDPSRLARTVGLRPQRWEAISAEVLAMFVREDGALSHPRLSREMERYEKTLTQKRGAGARGGTVKALNSQDKVLAAASSSLDQPEPEPKPDSETVVSETRGGKKQAYVRRLAEIEAAMAAAGPKDPPSAQPAADRAAPCGAAGVRAALSPLVLVYGVGEAARSSAFWSVYVEALSGLPAQALRCAVADYAAGGEAQFFPKPGPLKALALKHAEPLRRAALEAARAGEAVAVKAKPPIEERRAAAAAALKALGVLSPSPPGEGRARSAQGGGCA